MVGMNTTISPIRPRFTPPATQIDALVLLVAADTHILHQIRDLLKERGARVVEATDGVGGIGLTESEQPDLIVLDAAISDLRCDVAVREMRSCSNAPILVLSSQVPEVETVRLLDAGADDHLVKPFGSMEMLARIRAHLRRAVASERYGPPTVQSGDIEIDLHRRAVFKRGDRVHLTPLEWLLLRTLVTHAGRTLTHRQLFDSVWARSHGNASQYLRVFVTALRKKIEPVPSSPRLIITEPGVGYRFERITQQRAAS
jgi:two-component system, OmpR family, KDP operon response regulator KdpE